LRSISKVDGMIFLARVRSLFKATPQWSPAKDGFEISLGNLLPFTLVLFIISLSCIEFLRDTHSITTL